MEETGTMYIRKCRECNDEAYNKEDLSRFVKRSELPSGYQNLCKICHRSKYKASLDWVKSKYGISKEEYKERMNTSKNCQVCGSTKELCYDHDHDTMEFRGVLCRACNRSIGQLGDNIEGLEKALNYLKGNKWDY